MVVYTKILKIKRHQRNISSHNGKTWPRVWRWALWTTPCGHVLSFISDLVNILGLGRFSNPAPGLVKATDSNFWAPCLQKMQSHVYLGSKERDLTYGHLWVSSMSCALYILFYFVLRTSLRGRTYYTHITIQSSQSQWVTELAFNPGLSDSKSTHSP